MLTRLSNLLHKYAKGWLILILFLLDGLFMSVVMPGLKARMDNFAPDVGPIDLLFFYTPEKAYQMVAAYGEQGRAVYRIGELTVDIIYPIVYTLFFSLFITWLFQRGFVAESRMQILNVVPFGAWLFDLLENLGIVGMLSIYPSTPAFLAWVTTVFTMTKWIFAGTSVILVAIGIIAAIIRAIKH